ncbi:hypothetical protein EHI8A_191140 [Entamoeba histolytica HM-1:IMSS-B]|uniref:Uncharacterized protein n=6 Tax=Entamoeba histolytica TaxID=5759 RepID=C4MA65_ENTH1|nr:hypothetical protein EHI_070000 [Entamoeba histolytica HM-1:IMSS]EMD45385.1 cation efflux protein/ zinc transporter, putative [Entamoeba histolytica KU27]EMH78235.1 hypothetical protein EHI8A_191140 [Entamoeba histolytica HM-1:IMSS-B]EMS11616.1 cation efflux protein/ zinc transporter, putative [Entamoeba histolytica HM-3:IMSS]ENY62847.1 cation efflux protein/ zinc transporter, putative [Entamoeba histolytica HM-1:IMSS-A]GAT98652.1 hypothetical protein CL6EHI_070000 [Entamoeba histolytica]|eukprot:XP_648786.1 hypothetical protein EHI_070000 [Entamoeba histolytica HM-1:IMSS]
MNELKHDKVTQIKQMLIAIPNGDVLYSGHYEELFSVTTLELMMVKLNKLKWRLNANPTISKEIKNQVNSMVKTGFENILWGDSTSQDINDELKLLESSDSPCNCIYEEQTSIPLYNQLFHATPEQLERIYDIIIHSNLNINETKFQNNKDEMDIEFTINDLSKQCLLDIQQILNELF